MLSADRDALICDLAETYHVLYMWALPIPLLATLASGLREDSRIKMRIAGLNYISPVFVLPQIHDVLVSTFSDKGKKPRLLTDAMTKKEKQKATGFAEAEDFDAWRNRIINGASKNG